MTSHQSRIYGYIQSLVFDRHHADDLLQQTNAVLLRKANEFESGTNFVAWAFRIAYFEVMHHRRRLQREQLLFDDELLGNLAEAAQAQDERFLERQSLLRQCLDQMNERHRDIIRRRYLFGADLTRIANDAGSSVNAVKAMLFRAREALRACVETKMGVES